ncbi:SRPBCC family protein [Actinomadura keratinilytica]|jgi:hypothetical protein|uniref:SRPBCC family protein n=1 Tax=Actinomadura keratinilytica TaxID=547461 RepID=A0ABP7ZF51_9ACTN
MPIKSYASTVLSAPADEVWRFLRDFGNLADWMPGVATCAIEDGGPADRVGCVRRVIGPGDTVFREQLSGMDDDDRFYRYRMLESPLPIRDYVARIRVAPVTGGGGSFVEWQGEFSADAADEEAMRKTITDAIYNPALEALGKRFS